MTKETFQHSKKAKRQNGLTWPFQMPFPYSDTEIEMFDDVWTSSTLIPYEINREFLGLDSIKRPTRCAFDRPTRRWHPPWSPPPCVGHRRRNPGRHGPPWGAGAWGRDTSCLSPVCCNRCNPHIFLVVEPCWATLKTGRSWGIIIQLCWNKRKYQPENIPKPSLKAGGWWGLWRLGIKSAVIKGTPNRWVEGKTPKIRGVSSFPFTMKAS